MDRPLKYSLNLNEVFKLSKMSVVSSVHLLMLMRHREEGRQRERNQHPGNMTHNKSYGQRSDQQWTKGNTCSCEIFSSSSSYTAKWVLMFRLTTVPLHMSVALPSNSSQVFLEADKGGVGLARKGEGREDHSCQQERILNLLEEEREVMSKPVYWSSSERHKKKKWWSSG